MNLTDTINQIIQVEGGYSNNPNDAGGPTMYGITEAVAKQNGYTGDMHLLPVSLARTIYANEYWYGPQFDKVAVICQPLAEQCLDACINMGQTWPGQWIQRALNVLNQNGTLWSDMKVDGSIGPVTVAALKTFLSTRGQDGITVILRMFNDQRGVRYIEIAENNPKNETFEFGWILNRVQ